MHDQIPGLSLLVCSFGHMIMTVNYIQLNVNVMHDKFQIFKVVKLQSKFVVKHGNTTARCHIVT
jgi:hypothetical protein